MISNFKKHINKIKIVNKEESVILRKKYIDNFVDIKKQYYKNNIERMKKFSDGYCYTGYLWDCLYNFEIIKFNEFKKYSKNLKTVFVFWDIHSADKILIKDYWKFEKDTMLELDFSILINILSYLPEDIYMIDILNGH